MLDQRPRQGQPNIVEAGAQLERSAVLLNGPVERSRFAISLAQRQMSVRERIRHHRRVAALVGGAQLSSPRQGKLSVFITAEARQDDGPVQIGFDVAWVDTNGLVEGDEGIVRAIGERE